MASEMGCPIEMHKIRVEQCDEMYDAECSGEKYMPFYRAGYDSKTGQSPNMPREQVSDVSEVHHSSLGLIPEDTVSGCHNRPKRHIIRE